jgi:hypothetical protein
MFFGFLNECVCGNRYLYASGSLAGGTELHRPNPSLKAGDVWLADHLQR